jgi:hypothetical protein
MVSDHIYRWRQQSAASVSLYARFQDAWHATFTACCIMDCWTYVFLKSSGWSMDHACAYVHINLRQVTCIISPLKFTARTMDPFFTCWWVACARSTPLILILRRPDLQHMNDMTEARHACSYIQNQSWTHHHHPFSIYLPLFSICPWFTGEPITSNQAIKHTYPSHSCLFIVHTPTSSYVH